MLTNQSSWPDSAQILHYQYEISVIEVQTSLLVKRPQWQEVRRNGSFHKYYLSMHHMHICFKFYNMPLNSGSNLDSFFLSNHSPLSSFENTWSWVTQLHTNRARNNLNLPKQREVIFGLLHTIPHPWAERAGLGVARGNGNRSNWTIHKPCIWNKTFYKHHHRISAAAPINSVSLIWKIIIKWNLY